MLMLNNFATSSTVLLIEIVNMESRQKKHTVLWADDDADDMMIMRDVLKESDYNLSIIEVPNGKEAIKRLDQWKEEQSLPCLVILDMNMPVMNGRETLLAIKSNPEFKDMPLVVFTTSNSDLDKMFCRQYNVELITKPPSFTGLKEVIQHMLKSCISD